MVIDNMKGQGGEFHGYNSAPAGAVDNSVEKLGAANPICSPICSWFVLVFGMIMRAYPIFYA